MPNPLPLVIYPNSILRTVTIDLATADASIYIGLAEAMGKTMEQAKGVGLAAVQVNQLVRLAVINKEVAGSVNHLALLNPCITWHSWRHTIDEEGCLSLPGVFGDVRRHTSIEISYMKLDGTISTFKARGLLARVLQHEIDHLDGVLFIDRTLRIKQGQNFLDQWNQLISRA